MNDGNLYQAPAVEPPAFPPQTVPVRKPPSIQVFGILHLLAGGYGLVTGLWSAYLAFAGNPFISILPPGPARDAQASMTAAIQPMVNINLAVTVVLMVLVVTAGVKLLKNRKNAVKASNLYAVMSLIGKIIAGILIIIYMVPAQRQFIEQQFNEMGGMPSGMKTGMDVAMVGGAVMGILFSCVYPTLSLIFLNRRSVKAWLEQSGR